MEGTGNTVELLASTVNHHTWVDISMAKVIIFPPGCYGSWVHWVLNHLSGVDTGVNSPPLNKKGDAHNWTTKNCFGHLTKEFMDNPPKFREDDICRGHTNHDPINNDIIAEIRWILDNLGKSVYLYADEASICWMANVKLDKIWEGEGRVPLDHYFSRNYEHDPDKTDWEFIFSDHLDNLKQWPSEYDERGILSRWIIREYLSLILYKAVYENMVMGEIDMIKSLDLLPINVIDLRDDFVNTIRKIADHLHISINGSEDALQELYLIWKETQKHFSKDQLISEIIEATIKGEVSEWSDLSIVDEALIQHYLRERGYELKCVGLNDFPSNSKQLRELIYAT